MRLYPVPSYPRLSATIEGNIVGPSSHVLSAFPNKDGYLRVSHYLQGKIVQLSVHRLVCESFHGPSEGRMAAHRNGDPSDNRPTNLRWATGVENEADKVLHGSSLQGSRHHQAKLTDAQALEIRRRRESGEAGTDLAREFGVSPPQVCAIYKRRSWGHL